MKRITYLIIYLGAVYLLPREDYLESNREQYRELEMTDSTLI